MTWTMTEAMLYDSGAACGEAYARSYGPHDATREARRLADLWGDKYAAGYTDAVLDYVQTREELAPGCYRVRPLRGAE